MNRRTHQIMIAAAGLTLAAGVTVGCSDEAAVVTTTDYAYDDAYVYGGYYPADVAYASYAWAYPFDYSGFYYLAPDNAAATPAVTHSGVAAAIEALARGQEVCPGQATVTEKTAVVACATNAAAARAGVSITFNNCAAPGGTINGTVDVTGTATASDQACGATTTISLSHTSTFTNLSITVADGRKLVIPNQTNMGMSTFTFGQSPTMTTISSNGELQIIDSSGSTRSDLTYMGDNTFTFHGNASYTVDGITNVQEKNGNAHATVTRQGLERSQGCCRPTGGTITVDRTGGSFPGQANWTFGPSCGEVQRNNATASMPTCM